MVILSVDWMVDELELKLSVKWAHWMDTRAVVLKVERKEMQMVYS